MPVSAGPAAARFARAPAAGTRAKGGQQMPKDEYRCQECGAEFMSRDQLDQHNEQMHKK
jgi:hypothetical protein